MSNEVLPSFPGLSWGVQRKPVFSTTVKTSVSGREFRRQNYLYPRWQYRLVYEVLRARPSLQEMQTLAGFYMRHSGAFDSWLYSDPDDNAVTGQAIGTGNGTNKFFQLVRSFGGYTEPVIEPVPGSAVVYSNGIAITGTFNSTGGFTADVAPPNGRAITWSGFFYWRCRFLADQLDFEQFMYQFWKLGQLEFITVKP